MGAAAAPGLMSRRAWGACRCLCRRRRNMCTALYRCEPAGVVGGRGNLQDGTLPHGPTHAAALGHAKTRVHALARTRAWHARERTPRKAHALPAATGPPRAPHPSQARGADALCALAGRRAREARGEARRARVRARLRLRRLTKDPLLSPHQFESACGRLLQHSAALMQHAEGLSLRVSDANRVDGQWIDVAWDAEP